MAARTPKLSGQKRCEPGISSHPLVPAPTCGRRGMEHPVNCRLLMLGSGHQEL